MTRFSKDKKGKDKKGKGMARIEAQKAKRL